MKTVNSISGGKTSAYVMANYPADYNLFSLVRIEDMKCKFPDEKIRLEVEDRIQKPFIATAEDDMIIYTMLDLEQYLGKPITWVSGITYDQVIATKGGWLPNKLHRYCTSHLKIEPMFYWWAENICEPVEMRIGFRANEASRMATTMEKLNADGMIEFNATFGKHTEGSHKGKNKWELVGWQYPKFPLIENPTYKDAIVEFWKDKPVRFAELNNCVGCFHRNPLLLKKMYDLHPNKMQWFNDQEKIKMGKDKRACWRSDTTYEKVKNYMPQFELEFENFTECDSGHCEL